MANTNARSASQRLHIKLNLTKRRSVWRNTKPKISRKESADKSQARTTSPEPIVRVGAPRRCPGRRCLPWWGAYGRQGWARLRKQGTFRGRRVLDRRPSPAAHTAHPCAWIYPEGDLRVGDGLPGAGLYCLVRRTGLLCRCYGGRMPPSSDHRRGPQAERGARVSMDQHRSR